MTAPGTQEMLISKQANVLPSNRMFELNVIQNQRTMVS